jgi:hypothetical protein
MIYKHTILRKSYDIRNILFRPKIFFAEKKNCGWKEPFFYFILFSVLNLIARELHNVVNLGSMFLPKPTLQYIFYNAFLGRAIMDVLVLGGLIILLLYLFRSKGDYLKVFQVLLFTQVSWFFLTSILVLSSGTISTFFGLDGFNMYHRGVLVLFHIIGYAWIIHTISTGVAIFLNIPYNKGIIPVGISFVIVLYLLYSGLFSNLYSLLLYYVYPNRWEDLFYYAL